MINEAKEELENALRHNYNIREEDRVRTGVMREEERVQMADNTIIISSESSSSDKSLEILYVESYGLGRIQIPTKPVMSSNKSFTFPPHCHQMTCQKHFQITHLIHAQRKNQQST